MSFNIPSHYRPEHIEYPTLKTYKETLEHNSQIPSEFKKIATWIPRTPIPYQDIEPLCIKINHKIHEIKSKILPERPTLVALDLINKPVSFSIDSSISPLISALNLDPPLCPTPFDRLLKKIDTPSYNALIAPKNFVECQAQADRLKKCIDRISKALNFLTQPLHHLHNFKEPWIQKRSISMPSQTVKFAAYAYHHEVQSQPVLAPSSFSIIHEFRLNEGSISNRFIVKYPKQTQNKEVFFKESSLLMVLNHPNIISCAAIDSHGLYFPYGTPWTTHLSNHETTPHQLKNYFLQIATALNYLHEEGFTHKDVKADNVIILNNEACLIDFGLVCTTDNDSNQTGSLSHMPPELFANHFPFSNKIDSWALGILLLQTILNKKTYLIKSTSRSSIEQFLRTHLNKPFPVDYFKEIQEPSQIEQLQKNDPKGCFRKIIAECLHGHPIHRLSMQDIIRELKSIYPEGLRFSLV